MEHLMNCHGEWLLALQGLLLLPFVRMGILWHK